MHERPVFHPRFGLVAEYNGRLFTSLDGEGYREILSEPPIEIVRVDPRVDRLDLHCGVIPRVNRVVASAARPTRSLTAALSAYAASASSSKIAPPPLATSRHTTAAPQSAAGRTHQGIEQLQSVFGLVHRHHEQHRYPQVDQLRNQLENLHRMQHNSRLRIQQSTDNYCGQQSLPSSGKLLSNEMFRNVQQQYEHNAASKRLIMAPKTNSVVMPFSSISASLQSNNKGQLFFVRTPDDAPISKSLPERTSTITSSTQSCSNVTVNGINTNSSWNKTNVRRMPDNMTVTSLTSNSRRYPGIPGVINQSNVLQSRQAQTSRGIPCATRLRSDQTTAGIYRPSLLNSFVVREGPDGTRADNTTEVLDLSKKIQRESVRKEEENKNSQTYTTDLVRYFQNFGADESMDLSEELKNSS